MPILSSEILIKYSAPSASSGNSVTKPAPNGSLGKFMSIDTIPDGVVNNLFADVTGDENALSNVDYQCLFVHNNNQSITLQNTYVWVHSQVSGGANIAIALDNLGPSLASSSTQQAALISDKNTPPTGVGTFNAPTTKVTGLFVGNLGPNQCKAVWVRRSATNSAPFNNDGFVLRVEGDTTA